MPYKQLAILKSQQKYTFLVMKTWLGGAGSLLLTLGTLGAYVGYASSKQQFLLVSDMFRDWPLAGSMTFGIGSTLMGLALLGSVNVYIIVTCTASAWTVIGSSEYFGQQWISIMHSVSTGLFLLTSYMAFASVSSSKHGALHALLTFWSGMAVLSGTVIGLQRGTSSWPWNHMMAASEVALLATYFVGYAHVFFPLGK